MKPQYKKFLEDQNRRDRFRKQWKLAPIDLGYSSTFLERLNRKVELLRERRRVE